MKRARCAAFAACVVALSGVAEAQQIQWTQTLNVPKGHNLPKGVVADILGIELGDTYDEAKPKLEKLRAEEPSARPLEEAKKTIFLPLPDRTSIEASYVGRVILRRNFPGSGPRKIQEMLTVHFSAPSSGHQVLAVERHIIYSEQGDQPRIGEMIAALKQKFKSEAKIDTGNTGTTVYFTFDNGAVYVPKEPHNVACGAVSAHSSDQAGIPLINRTGRCDVVMDVRFNHGISKDHATAVWFALHDYERGKANLAADYAFFENYVKQVQSRPAAPPPKL